MARLKSQERLKQMAKSGEIAKRILENKKAIEQLPKGRIDLVSSTERYYHEFGQYDDGRRGDYDIIEDTRVENDPALKRLVRFICFCRRRSDLFDDLSKPEKELLHQDSKFYLLDWGGMGMNRPYRNFKEKLLTRETTESEYNEVLHSKPSIFYAHIISKTFPNQDYKMNPEMAKLIDKKWKKKYGKDWNDRVS